MAILGLFSKAEEVGLTATKNSTTSGTFDADWCDSAIKVANNQSFAIGVAGTHTDLWFHFECYGDSAALAGASSDGTWLTIGMSSEGTGNFFVEAHMLNGEIEYRASRYSNFTNSNVLTTVFHPASLNRATFDFNIRINDGGTDYCDVYHNGVLFGTLTQSNTDTGAVSVNSITLENNDVNCNMHYSQIIIADESTLGMKIARMDPDSAGSHSAWTGDHTAIINPFDGLSILSDTNGERESWNLSAYPGPASPTGIRGVFQTSYASLGDSAVPGGFEHFLRVGGTDYDGAKIVPVPGTQHITEWANNPDTSSPWDTADLAALIAGVEAVA
ncbi:hypothetical protein [Sulfitobacter phage vB_SupP_AX]|nr:hypothetical protein [Sulfitobacter phage vB_SupP_AX]